MKEEIRECVDRPIFEARRALRPNADSMSAGVVEWAIACLEVALERLGGDEKIYRDPETKIWKEKPRS